MPGWNDSVSAHSFNWQQKAAKPTVQYLSNQQTDILMEQPDISTPKGRRDLAMILLLYDSAARVQELCDLRICDIRLDSLPVVHLLGKGRKSRDVPLTKPCAQVLRQYICENHLDIPERRNDQLFTNPQGKKLTRSGVSYVLAKYIHKANTAVGSFFRRLHRIVSGILKQCILLRQAKSHLYSWLFRARIYWDNTGLRKSQSRSPAQGIRNNGHEDEYACHAGLERRPWLKGVFKDLVENYAEISGEQSRSNVCSKRFSA